MRGDSSVGLVHDLADLEVGSPAALDVGSDFGRLLPHTGTLPKASLFVTPAANSSTTLHAMAL
jgi:hypothetical protein